MFVNGCEYKSTISTATDFWNLCQERANASMYLGIVLKNKDISVEYMSYV
jgi:hypothetical protein